MTGRSRAHRSWVLLGVFALGLAGAAASAAGSDDCCRGMHGSAGGSCESVAPAACCGGPLALHAANDTPVMPKPALAPAVVAQLPLPCLAPGGPADAASQRTAARLCRSVVLRL